MPTIDPKEQREILKQAIREWLDEQFATFGRWTFYGLMASAFGGVAYLALTGAGWHK